MVEVNEVERCQWGECPNERLLLPEGYKSRFCAEHVEQLRVMTEGRKKADRRRVAKRLEWRYARDMAAYKAQLATWQPIADVLDKCLSDCKDRFGYTAIRSARELFDQYKPREPKKPGDEGA
jgi:hypothetical protein